MAMRVILPIGLPFGLTLLAHIGPFGVSLLALFGSLGATRLMLSLSVGPLGLPMFPRVGPRLGTLRGLCLPLLARTRALRGACLLGLGPLRRPLSRTRLGGACPLGLRPLLRPLRRTRLTRGRARS